MSSLEVKERLLLDTLPEEEESLRKFIDNGLPGIANVSDEQVKLAHELYMKGGSYLYISKAVPIKRKYVLYLAHKFNWHQKKLERIAAISATLEEKVSINKIETLDNILETASAIGYYYRDIMDRYLKTKNPSVLESMDKELFKMYVKCIELMDKTVNSKPSDKPFMGLTLPQGGTLKKIDDNTIEVSPKANSQDLDQVLEALAELRRQRETNK